MVRLLEVRWKFWSFRVEMCTGVFVVELGVCRAFQTEVGGGLRWWLLRECSGGFWEASDGYGVGILRWKGSVEWEGKCGCLGGFWVVSGSRSAQGGGGF